MAEAPGSTPRAIDVAICTYRRDSLAHTIESVRQQQLPANIILKIIVADNDEKPSARPVVDAVAGITCHYVHAPARNISVARNACLDAAEAPLLAFIDDDEVASPQWIAALLEALDTSGADAVLGPALARYPESAPRWAVEADLHSTKPVIRSGHIATGYSCNVLLRIAAFGSVRFDPALGRTGGEDDVYFAQAVSSGVRMAYAPDAIVHDPIPVARLNLRWLLRRAFRNGQTYAGIQLRQRKNVLNAGFVAAGKLFACMALAAANLAWPARWRAAMVRGTLHAGALARYLGFREIQLY